MRVDRENSHSHNQVLKCVLLDLPSISAPEPEHEDGYSHDSEREAIQSEKEDGGPFALRQVAFVCNC